MTPPREEPGAEDAAAVLAAESPEPERPPGSFPVLQTILTIGVIQVVTMAFNVARSKIVAVTAGPVGIGTISVVDQLVALVTQISTFSLPYAAVKFLSAAHSESREAFVRKYIAFLRALLAISVTGAAIAIAIVSGWPAALGSKLSGSVPLVILGLLTIPAMNLTGLLTNTMAAARRTRASALMGFWMACATAALAGAGILIARLAGYYVGTLAAWVLVAGGGMIYLAKKEGLHATGPRFSLLHELKTHREILRFAAAIYVISFSTPLAYLVARYAVLHVADFHAAGILQAAMGPGLALATVMRSSNSLFLTPLMNRRIEESEKFRGAVQFLRALSLAIAFVALPIVLFPHLLLGVLYSSRFFDAALCVFLFVVAESAQLLAGVNQTLLIGLDQIRAHVVICLIGDSSIAGVSLLLVPRYGINGVAIAFLCHGVLVFSLTAWRLWKTRRMAIPPAMGWLPILVLAGLALTGAVARNFPANTIPVMGAKAAVWAVFGLLLVASGQLKTFGLFRSK